MYTVHIKPGFITQKPRHPACNQISPRLLFQLRLPYKEFPNKEVKGYDY